MKSNPLNQPNGIKLTRIKHQLAAVAAAGLCAMMCGCSTAKVSARRDIAASPLSNPATVYVADFDLEAADIKSQRGLLPALPKMPGPLGNLIPGTTKDPQVLAREMVDAMSTALVKDLTKAGLKARRLSANEANPSSGWLVRGAFTEVNQGNQMRRAVVGFGWGKTDLQVVTSVADLSQGTPQPFYEVGTAADSGRAPGAGPMIALNPAAAGVRFVIAGKDLERNLKHTAGKIAAEVAVKAKAAEVAGAY